MNCSTCRFWSPVTQRLNSKGSAVALEDKNPENAAGECRRFPPKSAVSVGGGFRAFPITRAVDGCGEWQESPDVILQSISEANAAQKVAVEQELKEQKKPGRPKKSIDGTGKTP